jgi:hypothetical protein
MTVALGAGTVGVSARNFLKRCDQVIHQVDPAVALSERLQVIMTVTLEARSHTESPAATGCRVRMGLNGRADTARTVASPMNHTHAEPAQLT